MDLWIDLPYRENIGRFLTADTITERSQESVTTLRRCAYPSLTITTTTTISLYTSFSVLLEIHVVDDYT